MDDISIIAHRTRASLRKLKQLQAQQCEKKSQEKNPSATKHTKACTSSPEDWLEQLRKEPCPSIPETVLYYPKDRQNEAKRQACKITRKKCKRARKNAQQAVSIIPTAQALTPEKQKRRKKGEIPCDPKSQYMQSIAIHS